MYKGRPDKGNSLIDFPANFTIIDIETTGLDPQYCEIIELSAIRVRNGESVDTYSTLVKAVYGVDSYVTYLTGITNEMLKSAPKINEILPEYIEFLGDDILVGHNVHFDINFIYDNAVTILEKSLTNNFIDTLRLSRKLLPNLNSHRLLDMAKHYSINVDVSHRALSDCFTTLAVFNALKGEYFERYSSVEEIQSLFKPLQYRLDFLNIKASTDDFDESHPFFNKQCVFTGALEKMKRTDAMQLVVNIGGKVADSVTKKTNFLVLGNNDFCKSIKDGKSNKQKKAEAMKLSGADIEIISEQVFYDMVEQE